jgi:hypothetical protein
VIGRYQEAEDYFIQSAEISARMSAQFFAARTDLLWGRMLLESKAQGDAERGRGLLTRAHTSGAANGYKNVERIAEEGLRRPD